ncbi:MAG TPA: FAD-binding protein [Solirubrobacteraceae bacterium]|nr:FAD-binding protein [Solirubrobacteraceae bacterium]
MTFDLLVIGAGMAGATAAARATQEGASVVVVEKGQAIGGSALHARFIWTAPTVEVMRRENPGGDPALSAKVVEDHAGGLDWVRSLGVEVGPPVAVVGFGRGCAVDVAGLLSRCERMVRDDDRSEIMLGAQTERLLVRDGAVTGAEIIDRHGHRRTIEARHTVLATGGFGGNPELRGRLIHPRARDMPLRANRQSTGDGLRLGLAAGAAFGREDAAFYGHLIAARVPFDDPLQFTNLTFYHSEHGVLLNLEGRRFCDETVGDHITPLSLIEQPEARALLIYDRRVHDEWMMQPYVEGVEPLDKFQLAYRLGARCAVADSLDEFAYLPEEWGYPGPVAVESLLAFNKQCEGGEPVPSRRKDATPLLTPPYYVIEVVPAITFTFGGLLIDADAQVLDARGQPIPGLLAAGADTGGVFFRAYAGGLNNALVFGLQAVETALASRSVAASSL